MAKYYGSVGYVVNVETEPGVWVEEPVERNYYGNVLKNRIVTQKQGSVNMDTAVITQISIIADPFANEHFDVIRYVEYLGKKWIVSAFDVEYPRITMTLGGLYNG